MQKLLLICLFLYGTFAFSQTTGIKGRCTDSRGKAVNAVVKSRASDDVVWTDSLGNYQLTFNHAGKVEVFYSVPGTEFDSVMNYTLRENEMIEVPEIRFPFQSENIVIVQRVRIDPFEIDELDLIDLGLLPRGGVENLLIYAAAGVSSNNELTSNYNVRGGAYTENLVYVNGFKVYRPFLARAGQQEGMSFIHSSLVQSIRFSAGGFENRYGDRLSSVLDIEYKKPDSLRGSAMASLLGVESHLEHKVNSRFNFLVGARYRSNGYLLNSLPTKGAYNPVFWDAQVLTNYAINENLTWSVLGHFSSNNYRFSPQTQETDFGTANEAYSFTIYFEGNEQTRFQTMMGGTSLSWNAGKGTTLDLYATVFNTDEREYFDILGQYYINELETDPSKEEFGDSISVLGIGSFLDHARNRLNATIINIYHQGTDTIARGFKDTARTRFRSHVLKWGLNYQIDDFKDVLSEWHLIDSAGYSLPQQPEDEITLFESIKSENTLSAQRYTSFIQMNSLWSRTQKNKVVSLRKKYKDKEGEKYFKTFTDTIPESSARWALSIGTRAGYTTANEELFITPRMTIKYYPRTYMIEKNSRGEEEIKRRNVEYRFSTGLYYQPPFYREFRQFNGDLNLNVLAQKSLHFVAGTDVYFSMWERDDPFKFTGEIYYKYLWDVNPYEIENVRTRYYADNNATGFAYGLDLNVNGQFVEGIESFFKLGLLSTREDILDDYYYDYYNADGEKIIFGYSDDQTVADSVLVEPGFVPRPTDQWVSFSTLIQDRMPGYESFSVQMGLQYGSRLPYGPPDFYRYKDTLRMKSYFRVDIGFSYDFLYKKKEKKTFWNKRFTDAIISLEVFNLLGVNNVLSKQWVQDVSGKYYSIPNYLTQRRYNLKLIVRF